jgi:hypothetical protein
MDKIVITPQKASRLLEQSPAKLGLVRSGKKLIVTMNGRQYYLEWTGVRYELELLPKNW